MKKVPIITIFTEGMFIQQLVCHARAAILVLDSDLEGIDDEEIARINFGNPDSPSFTNLYAKVMMDDDTTVLCGDESVTIDEVMARARAEVDKWMGERTT